MFWVIAILHVIVSIFLIMVVLLQTGKGADLGAAFGGASQTLFGGRGAATFLGKLTTIVAVVFMVTSLSLAYLSAHREDTTIMKKSGPAAKEKEPESPFPIVPGKGAASPASPVKTGVPQPVGPVRDLPAGGANAK